MNHYDHTVETRDWVCYPWRDEPLFSEVDGPSGPVLMAYRPAQTPVDLSARISTMSLVCETIALERRLYGLSPESPAVAVYCARDDLRVGEAVSLFVLAYRLLDWVYWRVVVPKLPRWRCRHGVRRLCLEP